VDLNAEVQPPQLPQAATDVQRQERAEAPLGDAAIQVSCTGCGRRYHRDCTNSLGDNEMTVSNHKLLFPGPVISTFFHLA
jgi:hypothetical protein